MFIILANTSLGVVRRMEGKRRPDVGVTMLRPTKWQDYGTTERVFFLSSVLLEVVPVRLHLGDNAMRRGA
jgi:hypothetical protein